MQQGVHPSLIAYTFMKNEDYPKAILTLLLYVIILILVSMKQDKPVKHTTPLGITNFIFDLPLQRKGSGIR
tara:strand:- start:203 stop:415 length:213 start_codon:yes stop_codon:yes gene_type:complete